MKIKVKMESWEAEYIACQLNNYAGALRRSKMDYEAESVEKRLASFLSAARSADLAVKRRHMVDGDNFKVEGYRPTFKYCEDSGEVFAIPLPSVICDSPRVAQPLYATYKIGQVIDGKIKKGLRIKEGGNSDNIELVESKKKAKAR